MQFSNVWVPYGAYWSSPFVAWQGSFATLPPIPFAAELTKRALSERGIAPAQLDGLCFGTTIPSKHAFYGAPWFAGLAGLDHLSGPTINQACATSVRCIVEAAQELHAGSGTAWLAATADRTSNGPHVYYPDPTGPGGTGGAEDWVMDNFGCDPLGNHSMLATAENVAKRHGFSTAEQHEVVLRREQQYRKSLADGAAFLKRFMTLPFEVPAPNFKKAVGKLEGDEGVSTSTPEGLAALKPVMPGGTVTFGGQTHPADGNAALIVTTRERARELASNPKIRVRLHGFGQARAELAYMPEATVPAAQRALAQAGCGIDQIAAIKTHNPFAINDLLFARANGIDWRSMNNYGCSLVWGHPQAPMGTRAIIELIEELALRGGGWGLFTGCAAGDTAMAVVLEVTD